MINVNGRDIETDADGFAVLRPADLGAPDYLLHANSPLAPGPGGLVAPDGGCARLAAARRLYRQAKPSDANGVRAVLADHTGGICVHQPEVGTIISFVAELRARRFNVVRGNPCQGVVQTYRLA